MRDSRDAHEQSYFDYQSATAQDNPPSTGSILDSIHEQDEPTECNTSRVLKSSAVDLLDEVFENSGSKTQNDSQATLKNNASSVSFDEFDFWTSTMTPVQTKKV